MPVSGTGIRGVRTCQSDRSSAFKAAKPLDSTLAPGQ